MHCVLNTGALFGEESLFGAQKREVTVRATRLTIYLRLDAMDLLRRRPLPSPFVPSSVPSFVPSFVRSFVPSFVPPGLLPCPR